MENWKPVVGFEGLYEVSDLGRVRSIVKRKNSYAGKIMVAKLRSNGYRQYGLSDASGKTRYFKGARLVALAFVPNPENKPQVNHINGIKNDDRLENLEWATPSENQIHAYRTGLSHALRGENHVFSKLTETDIPKIRELLASGLSYVKIGEIFGVHAVTIGDVKNQITWGWLK